MAESIHIVTTGVRTPLGTQSAPVAAAVRAGISALGEHPIMIAREGEPMPGAMDPELDPFILGSKRLLELAETAMREAGEPLGAEFPPIAVFVGLPEIRPGFSEKEAATVQMGVSEFEDFPTEIAEVQIFPEGNASGIVALENACKQIQRGKFDMCLVGGVDSYFHPDTMDWLEANRQLAPPICRSGFVPGEGAGFSLVMSERARSEHKLESMACVRNAAIGLETKLIKTEEACLGDGLTRTVYDAVRFLNPPIETINEIVCDMNGERYRGEEWAFVCLRLAHYFDDVTDYHAPSHCWGDMGAASVPLFTMLACEAAARKCCKGPRAMLWASSEGGRRGAVVLETNMQKI